MKKLTSAILGLALSLAVAGISFAQTPAPTSTSKDNGSAMNATTKKKSKKKANRKAAATTPAAPATSPK